MRPIILPLLALLAGCSTIREAETVAVKEVASAQMLRADGSVAGVATLSLQDDGIMLELAADAPGKGGFGVHLHSVGRCDAPGFASAGPHWNPQGKQHGHDNPAGAHLGDLPNLTSDVEGRLYAKGMIRDALWDGPSGLFDADGIAIVIHERPDDYRTDPSGNSGKRILCGVFAKP